VDVNIVAGRLSHGERSTTLKFCTQYTQPAAAVILPSSMASANENARIADSWHMLGDFPCVTEPVRTGAAVIAAAD